MNIIVVQTSKIAAPLNFAALFGRTYRTCLRPALRVHDSYALLFSEKGKRVKRLSRYAHIAYS